MGSNPTLSANSHPPRPERDRLTRGVAAIRLAATARSPPNRSRGARRYTAGVRDERAELSGPGPLLTGGGLAGVALLFFAQLRALARHRLDYPIEDDWRYYRAPLDLPDTLTWEWLAFPAFDTLHATGKLLDWSFLRLVSHDYHCLLYTSPSPRDRG